MSVSKVKTFKMKTFNTKFNHEKCNLFSFLTVHFYFKLQNFEINVLKHVNGRDASQ